jgi:hypothetical protein
MKAIHKKEVAFTAMMVAGMVTILITYNALLSHGFNISALQMILVGIVPTFLVALVIEMFLVGKIVHRLHGCIVRPNDGMVKYVLVLATLFVTFMAAIMSLYGTILGHGFNDGFLMQYALNFARNWPVAFVAQLAVVGPLVRVVHPKLVAKLS